jgi:hypothetical protein
MTTDTAASATITRIALLAIDSKDASQLWNIVDRFLAKDFVIGVSTNADVAIMDSDAHGFAETLRDWQATHAGAPAVAFSVDTKPDRPDLVHVRKPLHVPELIAVLGKLGHRVREQRAASTGVVTVDICMSTDPMQVLDTIGIATDISGSFRYPGAMAGTAPIPRATA